MAAGGNEPTSGSSLFHDSDFMKFWVGQSISVFGSQFSPFALGTMAVIVLKADAFQLGILAFLNTIPFLTLGLFVGVWADRHRRRRILILADLGRALTLVTVPISALLFVVTLNLLYAVTLVAGILTVFFEIAYQAYVPSLVQRRQIVDANSKLETTRSTAQVVGPTAAGVAVDLFSAPMAVFGDVLGYISSCISLTLIRRPEPKMEASRRSTWHDIREGLSVVFKDTRLRSIALTTSTSNLFSSAYGAILLKYLYDDLTMTPGVVGLAFGLGSIGGVLGALLALRLVRKLGVGRTIILGAAMAGPFMPLVYLATPATAFYILVPVQFVTLFFVLVYNIPQVSYRQSVVPPEIQGRMNATMRTLVWGTIPIGGLMGGVVGQLLGVHQAIGVMTALGILPFLFVLLSPVRSVREFPGST